MIGFCLFNDGYIFSDRYWHSEVAPPNHHLGYVVHNVDNDYIAAYNVGGTGHFKAWLNEEDEGYDFSYPKDSWQHLFANGTLDYIVSNFGRHNSSCSTKDFTFMDHHAVACTIQPRGNIQKGGRTKSKYSNKRTQKNPKGKIKNKNS